MDKEKLIQDYLSDRLRGERLDYFNQLIKTDAQFKAEVEEAKDLHEALISRKKDDLKASFNTIEQKNISTFNYKKLLIAAILIIGLGLLTIPFLNKSTDHQKLYAQHFEPYRNIIKPIERGTESNDLETTAFYNYEKKHYQNALKDFDSLYKKTNSSYLLFYKANCLLELDKNEQAIKTLLKHQEFKDSFFDKSKWYLALAYLKNNQIENAKSTLNSIVLNKTYKHKEAMVILNNLE